MLLSSTVILTFTVLAAIIGILIIAAFIWVAYRENQQILAISDASTVLITPTPPPRPVTDNQQITSPTTLVSPPLASTSPQSVNQVQDGHWINGSLQGQEVRVLPYYVNLQNSGLQIHHPTTGRLDGAQYSINNGPIVQITWPGANYFMVNHHDALVANVQWHGSRLLVESPMAQGSPYMTFVINDVEPNFFFSDARVGSKTPADGRQRNVYVIRYQGGDGYAIFSDPPLAIHENQDKLVGEQYNGVIRLAYFHNAAELALLRKHVKTYPHNGNVSVNDDVLTLNWDVVGDPNNLLMIALPHHVFLPPGPQEHNIHPMPIRGPGQLFSGNDWRLRLHPINPRTWLSNRYDIRRHWMEDLRWSLKSNDRQQVAKLLLGSGAKPPQELYDRLLTLLRRDPHTIVTAAAAGDDYHGQLPYADWYLGGSYTGNHQPVSPDKALELYYALYYLAQRRGDRALQNYAKALLSMQVNDMRIYHHYKPWKGSLNIDTSFDRLGSITDWTDRSYAYHPDHLNNITPLIPGINLFYPDWAVHAANTSPINNILHVAAVGGKYREDALLELAKQQPMGKRSLFMAAVL